MVKTLPCPAASHNEPRLFPLAARRKSFTRYTLAAGPGLWENRGSSDLSTASRGMIVMF
jgi:hypothetical protein